MNNEIIQLKSDVSISGQSAWALLQCGFTCAFESVRCACINEGKLQFRRSESYDGALFACLFPLLYRKRTETWTQDRITYLSTILSKSIPFEWVKALEVKRVRCASFLDFNVTWCRMAVVFWVMDVTLSPLGCFLSHTHSPWQHSHQTIQNIYKKWRWVYVCEGRWVCACVCALACVCVCVCACECLTSCMATLDEQGEALI